jgi:hypothetical protein
LPTRQKPKKSIYHIEKGDHCVASTEEKIKMVKNDSDNGSYTEFVTGTNFLVQPHLAFASLYLFTSPPFLCGSNALNLLPYFLQSTAVPKTGISSQYAVFRQEY